MAEQTKAKDTDKTPGFFNIRHQKGFGRKNLQQIVAKPRNFCLTLQRLWQYSKAEQTFLLAVFMLILLDAALMLVSPYLIGKIIDAMTVQTASDFHRLGFLLLALAAAYLVSCLLGFFEGWMMAGMGQRVVGRLRSALFLKLQKLPLVYFDTHYHGDTMSSLTNDVDNVSNSIAQSVTHLLSGILGLIGAFIMMLVLSPLLTFVSLITVPLVILLTRGVTAKTGGLFREQQEQLGRLNGQLEETITGFEVVKAFNQEQQVLAEFGEINKTLCRIGTKAQIWSGFLMPMMNVINNIGFAAIAFVGGMLAIRDLVTVGVIASFISYSRQFVRPLNEMANLFNALQSGVAGAERIFAVLDETEELPDASFHLVLHKPAGHVVFEEVSFGYTPERPVIKNLSFAVNPGSRIALVGETGAGKTTIVNLLARFYDVTGGRILLDGHDVRDYNRASLRHCFGIVLQDTYLFAGTIKENIRYGKPDATDTEVAAAAKLANATDFIAGLPQQYDTMLTENGSNLSQGQKQLLAIARIVLTNPAILILDEATSSIDTRTEIHIQAALSQVMKGRTTFIIAHRLHTIRDADNILVIKNGELVEAGTHQQLLFRQGEYAKMIAVR